MTTQVEPDLIHFLGPLTVPTSRVWTDVMKRGDELVITDEIREASLDRSGNSWLDLIDDPDGQVARWGKQLFQRGPWPAGKIKTSPGDQQHVDDAWAAKRDAMKITDPIERQKALREVDRAYGSAATITSRTTGVYPT